MLSLLDMFTARLLEKSPLQFDKAKHIRFNLIYTVFDPNEQMTVALQRLELCSNQYSSSANSFLCSTAFRPLKDN